MQCRDCRSEADAIGSDFEPRCLFHFVKHQLEKYPKATARTIAHLTAEAFGHSVRAEQTLVSVLRDDGLKLTEVDEDTAERDRAEYVKESPVLSPEERAEANG